MYRSQLMTLYAKGAFSVERKHELGFCRMHAVTRNAGDRLTAARVNDIFSERMCNFVLGLVAP